ncbi:ATP phosphoribosyltransferase [Blastochloris viridis]|uniref:ATP phosphoribosyltransferase n=1 Tax=Blastochloris viridis TaxID=1079 RepID=A0A0H5BNZ7_BLAVI|nr:ATP phosphoribosyltransferase [Blastochloris viridis]ALK08227.1 ATP phosphoribosyltransferase [Blastochloris viridis]BAR98508.1 ATP phosphoribosyltransferase [Blastochloris viridis]CUU44149.1 ATP phosphoribosyltransferase [Blastochloris viridis]
MNKSPLVLAVPSKGRLQENTHAFFGRAGMALVQGRGARDYRGALAGVPGVEVAYLSASEIAKEVAAGTVHFGVTGEDLVRETIPDADARVAMVTPLGFGYANVVVAVPQAWIDVATMHDLDDVATAFRAKHDRKLRVATKYLNLTGGFFARHGLVDYRIVESLGATEGTPATGAAELIVDITTTGGTLAANALKVLDDGVILRSEANLVASLTATWTDDNRTAAAAILDRIAAEGLARSIREVRTRFPELTAEMIEDATAKFGVTAPFGAPTSTGMVTLHCPPVAIHALASFLRERGAEAVTVAPIEYVFTASNPLWETLEARLG